MAPPRKTSQADGVDSPPNRRGPFLILPSLTWPFRRRSSSGSSTSTVSSPDTTPGTSPTTGTIHRARPDALRCRHCSTEFAYASQIISKGFTGRLGRAYLVASPQQSVSSSAVSDKSRSKNNNNLLNITVGKVEGRALVTGWHEVADISCRVCGETVGWKYVDAKDEAQKYKVGKFILETTQTVRHASWEDRDVFVVEQQHQQPRQHGQYPYQYEQRPLDGRDEGDEEGGYGYGNPNIATFSTAITSSNSISAAGTMDYWTQKLGDTGTSVSAIEFDSDDSDECDEIFAGTWDPAAAAKRRSRRRRGISS